MLEAKRAEFVRLFQEFAKTYPATPDGEHHIAMYETSREQGRQNFEEIDAAAKRGADVADQVLLKLLPYRDTPAYRQKGAWTHIAPATGDPRERLKSARPDDWKEVAMVILRFVRRCNENPDQLTAACREFSELPHSKGFQTGLLTPILNALQPAVFLLANNKSVTAINHFSGTSYGRSLLEYPKLNEAGHELIGELTEELRKPSVANIRDADLFDMFSHWLVGVRKYFDVDGDSQPGAETTSYWKVAPGRNARRWEECRDGGFIAIGWDELGDVSGLTRTQFEEWRDELLLEHPDWNKERLDQVWTFAHIEEGDRIVANRGTRQVLGIGTVTGPYEFVPDVRYGHRLPVEWNDLTPRQVEEGGWRRTLVRLSPEKFEVVSKAPPLAEQPVREATMASGKNPWSEPLEHPPGLEAELQKILERSNRPEQDLLAAIFRRAIRLHHLHGTEGFLGAQPTNPRKFSITVGKPYACAVSGDPNVLFMLVDDDPHIREAYKVDEASSSNNELIWILGKLDQPSLQALLEDETVWDAYKRMLAKVADFPFAHVHHNNRGKVSVLTGERYGTLVDDTSSVPSSESPFSAKTFELLAELHKNPTADFYRAHKEEFKEYVEKPLQQLFSQVAEQLPAAITESMETQSKVFAKITKNDWGRGGAWDFYWGAFYPKGGKRIQDAQLFLWINRERLDFGFYIGEYGSGQRERFIRNCKENREVLPSILRDSLARDEMVYGRRKELLSAVKEPEGEEQNFTWEGWLTEPEEEELRASVVLPKHKVLASSEEELIERITQTYERLYPLVLLATTDEPIPAIGAYLGATDGQPPNPVYSLAQCAEETGFDEERLKQWVRSIERKGQAVIYGPPGTGKTYIAERLARHLIGGTDGYAEIVQFHPEYAYEDFIQGIRPQTRSDGGLEYPSVPGRFLEFCREGRYRDGCCVLIVDEINRANLSRVFGELMYLLEYRDREVPLAGGGSLSIPKNVRLIGTMNTADRSIILADHALRRRFAFLKLYPDYEVLRRYHEQTGFPVDGLIAVLTRLNQEIGDPHHEVGITFFLHEDLGEQIEDVWQMEIEPYLEEYFFDQPDKVDRFRWDRVRESINL